MVTPTASLSTVTKHTSLSSIEANVYFVSCFSNFVPDIELKKYMQNIESLLIMGYFFVSLRNYLI
jgi:hypothetical protein